MRNILSVRRPDHFRPQAALIVMAALTLTVSATATQAPFKLTYDKPASKWTEALPLGNGRIGAMVFSGTSDERLQINESTLWGGGPHDYTSPEAASQLEEIRRLIFAGKVEEAERLSETMMGTPKMLMPYQPFCDLRLHFPRHDQATEYRRELKLDDAIAETTYKIGSVNFRREVFVSYRFRNYRDISGDALAGAHAYLERASKHSYDSLRNRHLDDFRQLFSRVQLRLGEDRAIGSTDQRLKSFGENEDPSLLALYFEFGRYLLISSSRPGGQPANLQGIWNEGLRPAWGSKWTTGTPFAGRLVTNPSTSPENQYLLNGQHHYLTYAPAMDIELIRELFKNCRRAAEILATDTQFRSALDRAEKRLPPLQIGKRGQLQEWIEDYGENEPQHRHVSHLYSLYPGHDISLEVTPELAAAVKKSLELRGDGESGWSTMWRTALWARLQKSGTCLCQSEVLNHDQDAAEHVRSGPAFSD